MFPRRFPFVMVALLATALSACAPAATPTVGFAATTMPAATAAPAATTAPAAASAGQQGLLPPAGQMIIKNADIELLVPDSQQALARVTQLAADDGGYVIRAQTWFDGDLEHATLQLAVPATQFEPALNTLRNLGSKVLKESTTGQDVSAQYTDLQSRLDNLEATAARVRTFLDASKTVEDSLNVNDHLSELEGQIEQIKGQMKYYEGRTAFSTVTVTLTPVIAASQPKPEPAWDPLGTFARATAALGRLLRVSADASIWLVVLSSPLLVILLGVLLVRRFALRRAPSRP